MADTNKEEILKVISSSVGLLRPSQKRLCLPIIHRISTKMKSGIRFDDIKVCEGLIIDGHHRYISSLLATFQLGMVISLKTSATIQYDWENVEFVEEEWDTAEKIMRLNQLDAEFNKMPIDKLIELTK